MQSSVSENRTVSHMRSYERAESIVFLKTKEAFGGLSNMAGGFPLRVNGIRIFTSEALYQACRFPHLPDVQRLVISEASPMTAKMKTKPYRQDSRFDWDRVRVRIMRWCLRVKLVQNWKAFGELLLATGDKPIVEESYKDDFWGAKPVDQSTLVGMNVLGRLLMELREEFKSDRRDALLIVEPLLITDFLLMGQPIPVIEALALDSKRLGQSTDASIKSVRQPSLFDQPTLFDVEMVAEQMREENKKIPQTHAASKTVIVDLKPYQIYKDSGLPWLGQVPVHWVIKRAKSIFHCIDQRSPTGKEELLTVSSARGIVPRKTAKVTMFKAESYVGYKLCWPGDLVINSLWAWGGGLGVSKHHGIISTAYSVYRIRPDTPMTPDFIHEVVRSSSFNWEFKVRSKGVWISRLQLTDISFLDAPMYIPPLDEQAAIVRFLDWTNGRLERAIRLKHKTIALLNEQKQAIIHRAVTRGLDPDVPLKDSGIPWLGQIPAHWEVWRISRFARVGNGSTPSRARPQYWSNGNYPWLNSSQVNRGHINSSDQFVTATALRECHLPKVPSGSVLVAITGQGKTRGMSAVLHIEATINQHIAFITPRSPVASVEFINLALTAAYKTLRALSDDSGSTKGALTCEDLKRFKIAIPPAKEQQDLLGYIRSETNTLNTALTRLDREIELLREYRTRLVADVVTGKLDVREAAARLPEMEEAQVAEPELAEIEETGDELAEV